MPMERSTFTVDRRGLAELRSAYYIGKRRGLAELRSAYYIGNRRDLASE